MARRGAGPKVNNMQDIRLSEAAQPRNPELLPAEYAITKVADRFHLQREFARVVARLAGIGPQDEVVK